MSLLSKLFYSNSAPLDIEASKESLRQLEALTEEINAHEQEIRIFESMLRSATDSLSPPVWGKDLDGRFVFMNPACAENILKTTVTEALNLTDLDFVGDALAQVCIASDMVVMLSMGAHRFIEHARYDDGSDVWLDTVKSPWLSDGKLVGTVGVGRVITKIIPEDIRDKYQMAGHTEIGINLMYNPKDIKLIMEGIK